jgi:hypothetical protein
MGSTESRQTTRGEQSILEMLPVDLYTHIRGFLYPVDYQILAMVSTTTHIWTQDRKHNLLLKHLRCEIESQYTPLVRSLMGGTAAMTRFPVLQWQNRFRGTTNYIDGIRPNDMSDSVMRGIDPFERSYVAVRTKYVAGLEKTPDTVTVLFQRYSYTVRSWTQSTNGYGAGFVYESGHFVSDGRLKHKLLRSNLGALLKRGAVIPRYPGRCMDANLSIQLS